MCGPPSPGVFFSFFFLKKKKGWGFFFPPPGGGGGVSLPYMGYIGMCRCDGYGFQAVYSRIGYINPSVWV